MDDMAVQTGIWRQPPLRWARLAWARVAPSASVPASEDGATTTRVASFETFFHQHEAMVFGYLFRMTGNEAASYDLSQETFLRAWQHFDAIQGYDLPRAWLLRVATNLALNHAQRQKTVERATVTLDDDNQPASSDPTVRLAERDLVRQVLLRLVPRQRAALVLREVYGLPFADVGRMLGISPAATRMLLWRAREQFRAQYLAAGGQPA
jgi:RNA polymerase sigma-70 factor (ECF subfamily)